jgi:NAD-dependent SIR2 family protein deacetylase
MIQQETRANYSTVQCSRSEIVAMDGKINNPKCPSCGHAMWLSRTVYGAHPAQDHNVFQCPYCKITYMTHDHTGVNGHEPSH